MWALFVDPDAEGVGIGRALHERMLLGAKEKRIARLALMTDKRTRAARFYRAAGWLKVGTSPEGEALLEIALLS